MGCKALSQPPSLTVAYKKQLFAHDPKTFQEEKSTGRNRCFEGCTAAIHAGFSPCRQSGSGAQRVGFAHQIAQCIVSIGGFCTIRGNDLGEPAQQIVFIAGDLLTLGNGGHVAKLVNNRSACYRSQTYWKASREKRFRATFQSGFSPIFSPIF